MRINNILVQGAGHIMGINNNGDNKTAPKYAPKCALYEDVNGDLYCTANLIPLNEWLAMYNCNDYVYI